MKGGFKSSGILTAEELRGLPGIPSEKRAAEGTVAVIECAEEFPCDPCESSCVHGAIIVGRPITNLPHLKEDLCIGCGECIVECPGLAIFMMDLIYSENEATVSIPYEFLPLPRVGEKVEAVDRSGTVITTGRVIDVKNLPSQDRTAVVTIAVPKEFGWDVRGLQLKGEKDL